MPCNSKFCFSMHAAHSISRFPYTFKRVRAAGSHRRFLVWMHRLRCEWGLSYISLKLTDIWYFSCNCLHVLACTVGITVSSHKPKLNSALPFLPIISINDHQCGVTNFLCYSSSLNYIQYLLQACLPVGLALTNVHVISTKHEGSQGRTQQNITALSTY